MFVSGDWLFFDGIGESDSTVVSDSITGQIHRGQQS